MPKHFPLFAARLAALLQETGESRFALSIRAGLSKGAVADYLTNPDRSPRPRAVRRLALALEVDEDYLTGKSDIRRASTPPPPAETPERPDEIAALIQARAAAPDSGLRLFTAVRDGEAFGITATTLVVTERTGEPQTGQLVVTANRDGLPAARLYVAPYLLCICANGEREIEVRQPGDALAWRIVGTWRPF